MNSNVVIVAIDDEGNIALPINICEKIDIHQHDKLTIDVKEDTLGISKQKISVFDIQRKEVAAGTLKQALIFEQTMDHEDKNDMPM